MSNDKLLRRTFAGLLLAIAPVLLVRAADTAGNTEFPRDVLKGIDAMKRLPVEGFQIVESQGRLLLVSTNGHYVVTGGRILDLWNLVEVRSVADVTATERIPVARLGLEAKSLGGFSTGRGQGSAVTVFLDPASADSRKILPELRTLAAARRVDVVFIPAQASRAGVSRALICDRAAAQAFFDEGRVPAALPDSERCGIEQLQRARITVQLLGIHGVPFSIAPNGVTASGIPQNYGAFVAANLE